MRRSIQFIVERNRVLVPVGEPCQFGCRYCYTRGGDVGIARVQAEEVLGTFQKFAATHAFETIQFGYDGDPFSRPERGLAMLGELASMRKHVNFSTKALLSEKTVEALRKIQVSMQGTNTVLSALVSLSCWHSASIVEPHTPSPSERIQTIEQLRNIGIPVFIALRPILPHILDAEYEYIIDEGLRTGCAGFIPGPLYADAQGKFVRFVPQQILRTLPTQTGIVSWSAHSLHWTRYEDPERLQKLIQIIQRKGGNVFLSSADAMESLYHTEHAA